MGKWSEHIWVINWRIGSKVQAPIRSIDGGLYPDALSLAYWLMHCPEESKSILSWMLLAWIDFFLARQYQVCIHTRQDYDVRSLPSPFLSFSILLRGFLTPSKGAKTVPHPRGDLLPLVSDNAAYCRNGLTFDTGRSTIKSRTVSWSQEVLHKHFVCFICRQTISPFHHV